MGCVPQLHCILASTAFGASWSASMAQHSTTVAEDEEEEPVSSSARKRISAASCRSSPFSGASVVVMAVDDRTCMHAFDDDKNDGGSRKRPLFQCLRVGLNVARAKRDTWALPTALGLRLTDVMDLTAQEHLGKSSARLRGCLSPSHERRRSTTVTLT